MLTTIGDVLKIGLTWDTHATNDAQEIDSMDHYIVLAVILLVPSISLASVLYTGTHKRH